MRQYQNKKHRRLLQQVDPYQPFQIQQSDNHTSGDFNNNSGLEATTIS
ncbi:hypothetical protein [Siansivirga zeaxanthinifaciens]|nr:hypothetical protein [Siansivirga zeaxanthinifaciens]